MYFATTEEFLSHHGVKGMHWGIRNVIKDQTRKPLAFIPRNERTKEDYRKFKRDVLIGGSAALGTLFTIALFKQGKINMERARASEERFRQASERIAEAAKYKRGFVNGHMTWVLK